MTIEFEDKSLNRFEDKSLEQQEACLLELAKASLVHWSLNGQLRLIKHRENAVYELNTDNGERYALRIHRAGYHSDQALLSEMQWVQALSEQGISSPTAIKATNGQLFARVSTQNIPQARQVDLLNWLTGEPLGSVEEELNQSPQEVLENYKTIGEMAAKMHNQAVNWALPDGFTRHSWDVDGLVGEQPVWGPFWQLEALTSAQQALILQTREKVRQDLIEFGQDSDVYSLIHADFVPENFLVDNGKVQVIDFDDAGFGWHLFDIATALYFIQDDPNYEMAKAGLIEGYRQHRALSDQVLAKLPLFMAARSFTYLGWVHERVETQTAKELTPVLIELCCQACEAYLQ